MSKSTTRHALAALGSAFISLGTIRDTYDIGPVLRDKIGMALTAITCAYRQWPGVTDAGSVSHTLNKWGASCLASGQLDRDGAGTMMVLAQGALQAVVDLYERPSTRDWRHDMRPALDYVIAGIEAICDELRAGRESEWMACEMAEMMSGKLREVVGW